MVVKSRLEPVIDPLFHPDSYGYRPGKAALDAVGQARQRCWQFDWVIDLDIKGFFDNIDHELLMRAVRKHAQDSWVVLYISRWLTAPAQDGEGQLTERGKGTPQGGVISPLLANLFLHYAFDVWMRSKYPQLPFERYADDAIVHCRTETEAQEVRAAIAARMEECRLELHPVKTKIVYCKDDDSGGDTRTRSSIFWAMDFSREDRRIGSASTSSTSARPFPTKRGNRSARRFGAGICIYAVTKPSKICRGCSIQKSGAGCNFTGGIIARRCIPICVNWTARWPIGRIGNTKSCAAIYGGQRIGLRGFHGAIPNCLLTGRWARGVVPWREPYELRGSSTVLREPRGEIPRGYSP
jgi:hypothetical protein